MIPSGVAPNWGNWGLMNRTLSFKDHFLLLLFITWSYASLAFLSCWHPTLLPCWRILLQMDYIFFKEVTWKVKSGFLVCSLHIWCSDVPSLIAIHRLDEVCPRVCTSTVFTCSWGTEILTFVHTSKRSLYCNPHKTPHTNQSAEEKTHLSLRKGQTLHCMGL